MVGPRPRAVMVGPRPRVLLTLPLLLAHGVWLPKGYGSFSTEQLKYFCSFIILYFGNNTHFFGSTHASTVCLPITRDAKLQTGTDYCKIDTDRGKVSSTTTRVSLTRTGYSTISECVNVLCTTRTFSYACRL